jgi:hypothetical protein
MSWLGAGANMFLVEFCMRVHPAIAKCNFVTKSGYIKSPKHSIKFGVKRQTSLNRYLEKILMCIGKVNPFSTGNDFFLFFQKVLFHNRGNHLLFRACIHGFYSSYSLKIGVPIKKLRGKYIKH